MTNTLGKRLRQERRRLTFTQVQFADIGGVTRLSQSKYENDLTCPSAAYLQKLLQAKVDVLYVLSGRTQTAVPALDWDDGRVAFTSVMDFFEARPGRTYTSDQIFAIIKDCWQTMMAGNKAT